MDRRQKLVAALIALVVLGNLALSSRSDAQHKEAAPVAALTSPELPQQEVKDLSY
jgi:hypothetical protein